MLGETGQLRVLPVFCLVPRSLDGYPTALPVPSPSQLRPRTLAIPHLAR